MKLDDFDKKFPLNEMESYIVDKLREFGESIEKQLQIELDELIKLPGFSPEFQNGYKAATRDVGLINKEELKELQ